MAEYGSLHSAFHAKVNLVLAEGHETEPLTSDRTVGSNFGQDDRNTLEILADKLVITDPRNRLMGDCRRMNTAYAIANFLWSIDEQNTPEMILSYNEHGNKFLDDEGQFQCAIPNRIITSEGNLLKSIIETLYDDRSSRRAIIPFIKASDIADQPLDFPCPSYAHFFVRNDKLDLIVGMRSQSLVGVLPYDIFMFTMMQEAVALDLDVDLGKYMHISDSLHIYSNELEKTEALLECSEKPEAMEPMTLSPITNPAIHIAERKIRSTRKSVKINDEYWDQQLGLLNIHEQ